jgi:hypothetical protein
MQCTPVPGPTPRARSIRIARWGRQRTRAAIGALALVASGACAADTRVYRCKESTGAMSYSDAPCSNATIVDVDGGAAAPDARERLRGDQQALDARAAQRREALAREEAIDRMNAARTPPPPEPPPAIEYAYPAYGYAAPRARRAARDRDHRDDRQRHQRDRHIVVKPSPHPSPLR